MGLFRYIVQGFGWEVGRTAARETIDHVRELPEGTAEAEAPAPPSPRELKRLEAAKQKEIARKKAEIEAELRRLKNQK